MLPTQLNSMTCNHALILYLLWCNLTASTNCQGPIMALGTKDTMSTMAYEKIWPTQVNNNK